MDKPLSLGKPRDPYLTPRESSYVAEVADADFEETVELLRLMVAIPSM